MHGARVSGAALAVGALLGSGCDVRTGSNGRTEGRFERTLHVSGPASVEIVSRSGNIRVIGNASPGDGIRIVGRIRADDAVFWLGSYDASDRVKRIENDPPIEQHGNNVRVGDIFDWWLLRDVAVSYDVSVPPDTRLTTSTRSGDQTIEVIQGSVDTSSRSGALHFNDIHGPLTVSTRSGDVTASGAPVADWQVRTRSGDVALRLLPDVGVNLDARTRSGSILANREAAGEFDRRNFESRIRGGGARVSIATRSGSIRLE